MYNPAVFQEPRPEVLQELIAAHPLATLVSIGPEGLEATHLPLLFYPSGGEAGVLRGHLARGNPQWQRYSPGTEALAIFSGPQHYVSPRWYPSKKEHGKVVPTWNYAVVHARGTLEFHSEPEWLLANVSALTESQERSSPEPWRASDAPPEFIQASLRAIIGVELNITKLEGKWKMSQNRGMADREGVVAGLGGLGSTGASEIAALVKKAMG